MPTEMRLRVGSEVLLDQTKCPVMQLRVQYKGEQDTDTVARIAGNPSDSDWNSLLGGFHVTEELANAESIRLQFVSLCATIIFAMCTLFVMPSCVLLSSTLVNRRGLFRMDIISSWTT